MASKSRTKGFVPPAVYNGPRFPPRFGLYGFVPFPQQLWQGSAGAQCPVYPASNPYEPVPYYAPPPNMGRSPAVIMSQSSSQKPRKRVIRPPSKEYLATKLLDNPLGLTNMIPREELESMETQVHTPSKWGPIVKEDELTAPPFPTNPPVQEPEHFTSKQDSKPAFSSNIVRAPNYYVEPRETASIVPSSSASDLPPSILAPLLSISNSHSESPPLPTISPHSTSNVPPSLPLRSTLSAPPSITYKFPDHQDETPKASASSGSHPSHLSAATRSLDIIHETSTTSTNPSISHSIPRQQPPELPAPTRKVRRGYWNRRGDHLTPEGYLVLAPPSMQYPDDLRTYPFKKEGYQDHSGLFTAYVKRPRLPQSLPKHGKPPERPYESFVIYV